MFDEKGKKQLNTCSSHMFIQNIVRCTLNPMNFFFTYAPSTHISSLPKYPICFLRVILFYAYINKRLCPNLIMFNNLRSFTHSSLSFSFFSIFIVSCIERSLHFCQHICKSVLHHFKISIFSSNVMRLLLRFLVRRDTYPILAWADIFCTHCSSIYSVACVNLN